MKEGFFWHITLFLIKLFRGEEAYYDAIVRHHCIYLANKLQSRKYYGYVAKRKISRYMYVPMSTVGEIADAIGVESVLINRMSYYRLKDAARILVMLG